MKVRNVIWLSLIVVFACSMMVDASVAQPTSRIYVDPPLISNKDLSMSSFTVDIKVENVENLLVFAFELHFAKYLSILCVTSVSTGDLFPDVGAYIYDFEGFAAVIGGCPMSGPVSGSGTLARITFSVLDSGVSPLTLKRVRLYNSKANNICDLVEHGYYEGPVVNPIYARLGRRKMNPGQTQTFDVEVLNEGEVSLYAKAKIENVRLEDGKTFTFWAGQNFATAPPTPVYKYVDGFIPWIEEWTTVGTAPWLDAPDDGNYIEAPGPIDGLIHGFFTFEDLVLPAGYGVGRVTLEGYTDGPYNENVDYDMFSAGNFGWIGSLYATGAPAWVGVRWTGASLDEVDPSVKDLVDGVPTGFNDLMVIALLYDPTASAGPGDIIDSLRVKVEFAPLPIPVLEVPPGAQMGFDTSEWTLLPDDVGTYVTTVTIYCTLYEHSWNPAPRVKTSTWRVSFRKK